MDLLSIFLLVFILAATIAIGAIYNKDKLAVIFHRKVYVVLSNQKKVKLESIDYDTYSMKPLEQVFYIFSASLVVMAVGYVFYRSFLIAFLLTPISLYYPKIRRKQIINKRKSDLKLQFKDALQSLSSSLHAGRSIETALRGAIDDLMIQYDTDSYIIQELGIIARKLETNETVERAFNDFAKRSHVEEIEGFAEVLDICKRTGGNLIAAIKSSTDIITDKIEVHSEIQGILAQKKFEQKILSAMPIVIILMLSMSAMDFMLPVFTQAIGRIVMTFSMGMFAIAYLIAEKITNIEV